MWTYLADLNEQAHIRLELIIKQMAASEGLTEDLKASDPMKWVGLMNACKAQTEEIILSELIYN